MTARNDDGDWGLAPCPFCGGEAAFEHLENGRWSIGCIDIDGDCMGFQSLQTFARKAEAAAAWNTRDFEAKDDLGWLADGLMVAVGQYREAPFRSADWLAGEMMTLCEKLYGERAAPKPPQAPVEREAVARVVALHGLGTMSGLEHRGPPNASWTTEEWEKRILECVPERVVAQCYELADAILSLLPPSSDRDAEVRKAAVIAIAKAAHVIGWQAGVGGMETAGAIVSYLAQHQDQIEPFFANEVSPVDWPDFTNGGCLTWHASKGGKIVHPSELRAALAPEEPGDAVQTGYYETREIPGGDA